MITQPENSYSTSKHSVVSLTKTAVKEYSTKIIRINALCPTAIETHMIMNGLRNFVENPEAMEQAKNRQRMKPMGLQQEVPDVALWSCSDQSSFITGICIAVDGGAFA